MEPTARPESSFDELEHAIASVPGVAAASVTPSDTAGRKRLRIRLQPGQDAEQVSWAVATTLQERFGIDLSAHDIRPLVGESETPQPGSRQPEAAQPVASPSGEDLARIVAEALGGSEDDASVRIHATSLETDDQAIEEAAAARPDGPVRAVIRDLVVRRHEAQVAVTAVLSLHGRAVIGQASGPPTQAGGMRATAEATIAALQVLTGGLLHAGVDHVSFIEGPEDRQAVTVGVTVTARDADQALIGAAMLRDGTEVAVMRATLDALNRRVAPLLVAGELSSSRLVRRHRDESD